MSDGRWDLLGVTTGAFFVTMVARLAPSPLVTDVMGEFHVTKGTVGLALTGMWAAYALFQFPAGVVADRIGERRVVLAAVAATGLASALLASAPSFPLFAVGAVALGSSAGLYFTAGASFLTAQFDETGRALGVHELGASVAGLVAPVASAAVAARYDWRAGLLVPAGVAAVVFVLFWWRTPATPPTDPDQSLADQLDVSRLTELITRPPVLLTTVLGMGGFFTWQSFSSFFPTFLHEYVLLTEARAGLVFGGVFALTIVGAPALGWASDAIGRDVAIAGSFASGVAGYAVLLFASGPVALVAGAALVGGGLFWPGVVNSRFMDHLASDERGTGFGLVRTVLLLGSSLGSGVTGALAESVGWPAAYGLVAAVLAVLLAVLAAVNAFDVDA